MHAIIGRQRAGVGPSGSKLPQGQECILSNDRFSETNSSTPLPLSTISTLSRAMQKTTMRGCNRAEKNVNTFVNIYVAFYSGFVNSDFYYIYVDFPGDLTMYM